MTRQHQRLRALGALFALALAACGGGGGGGSAAPVAGAPGDPTGGASAAGPGVPAAPPAGNGNPVPAIPVASAGFAAFASTTVATGVQPATDNPAQPTVVTRLPGGGGVTVWSSGRTLLAQPFASGGTPTGPQITVNLLSGTLRNYAVTALADGSWVVLWTDTTQAAQGNGRQPMQTLQFKRYSAAGGLLQDTTPAAGPFFGIFPRVQARGTADGGFAIAWSANLSLFPPAVSFQRFDGSGTKAGTQVDVAGSSGAQTLPLLLPLPDNSLELLWLQAPSQMQTPTDSTILTLTMQHFDAQSHPLGAPAAIGQSTASGDFDFTAAVLTDGRIGLAWDEPLGAVRRPLNASWAISDTAGVLQTAVGSSPVATLIEGLDMAPAAGGGFALFSQLSTTSGPVTTSSIGVLRVDNAAIAQGTWSTLVSRTTVDQPASSATPASGPADNAYSVSGGTDGHYVLSYEAAVPGGAVVDVLGQ